MKTPCATVTMSSYIEAPKTLTTQRPNSDQESKGAGVEYRVFAVTS